MNNSIRITVAALALALFCMSSVGHAARASAADCEGDACSQVTVTFDESKQQYRAQNNSSDRWIRVSASNLAAGVGVCVAPGAAGYLVLKSIVGPYHADFSEPKCGEPTAGN